MSQALSCSETLYADINIADTHAQYLLRGDAVAAVTAFTVILPSLR